MTDEQRASLQESADALGCDLFVVPVPDPMEQADAIARRHGEGRHKTLRAMVRLGGMSDIPASCDVPVWHAGYRDRCGLNLVDGECPRHGLRAGGGAARDLIEDYYRRKGQPGRGARDAFYQYDVARLTDLLCRLEVILDDHGVDGGTRRQVIRAMLYGSPSEAEAEYRVAQERDMSEMLKERPLSMHVTGIDPSALARLGLPPR